MRCVSSRVGLRSVFSNICSANENLCGYLYFYGSSQPFDRVSNVMILSRFDNRLVFSSCPRKLVLERS